MVRDSLQAVLGEPEGPLFCPPGLTGGAESSGLAGKRQQPLVAAFRAPNAGKAIQGIAAIHEFLDHPLGDRPQSPEGVLELLFRPKILYPYHYGNTDTQQLVDLLADTDIEVRIRDMR